jgi:hypothetical protein
LNEFELKGDRLITLVDEILRQSSTEAVVWFLPSAFGQTCSKNWEQKAEQKDLKNVQFG